MNPTVPPTTRRPSRRGFSLLELVLVLTVVGVVSALFIPVIGNHQQTAAAGAARSAVSATLTAVTDAYHRAGTTDGPSCPGTADTDPHLAPSNTPGFVNPCALNTTHPHLTRPAGATTPTTDTTVSLGARATAGTWQVAAVATVTDDHTADVCVGAHREFPSGQETYVTYPASTPGCTAAQVLTTGVHTCSSGTTWTTPCVLPTEP